MGRRIKVTPEQVGTVTHLVARSEKIIKVARITGLFRPTVYRVLRNQRQSGGKRRRGTAVGRPVPAGTAILDQFLRRAKVVAIAGESYRLKDKASKAPAHEEAASEPKPQACQQETA